MTGAAAAWFCWGLLAAFLGAELFVRSSASLAARLGIPPVVIGLTVVAWGTSAPELVVSLRAATAGDGAIALGNVVGSNIFNVGFILGLAAIVHPLKVALRLVRFDAPFLVGVTLLFCLLYGRTPLSRAGGAALLAVFAAHVWLTLREARRERPPGVEEAFRRETPSGSAPVWLAAIGLVAGLALLVYGGQVLVRQAVVLARETGISERVIALTIVAAGTSSPELLTSVVAAWHRHADMAVGNIIGSNIFNLAAILGLSAVIDPIAAGGLQPLDLVVLTVSALVLLPLMRTGLTIRRWEGVVLLTGFAVYAVALLV